MARQVMHKFYIYRVTVRGNGEFPFDMLRADRACPASESDTYRMIDDGCREVTVVIHTTTQRVPNVGRWESFGWKVISTEAVN